MCTVNNCNRKEKFLQPKQENKPNRLINEKSLYLLQHAYNPVDWFPWGQEAIDKAKAEDKPIFLSIGYASCHWCHVMEEECFSDQEVADLLNQAFVCIKVDREERPDLDAAYMAVCQAMGRNCGWPLNILMTPKLNPFFAASYIPKTQPDPAWLACWILFLKSCKYGNCNARNWKLWERT